MELAENLRTDSCSYFGIVGAGRLRGEGMVEMSWNMPLSIFSLLEFKE